MKNRKSGQTFVEWLVAIAILLVVGTAIFGVVNKYVVGNKQFVDFKQKFNVAYVLSDSNKFERVKIKAWKDWENSDSIQVIKEDGTPIYTHLRNVKLTCE
jgi:hypothetical protein